ncbi:MAG: tetratricopeptide repeat protein [Nitrospiraceae bacterium]
MSQTLFDRQASARRQSVSLVAAHLFTLLLVFLSFAHMATAAQQAEADVLVARAVLAYDDQHYDEALELCRRALNLNPDNARALYYSGLTYLALKLPEQATGPLEKARKARPQDPNVRFQLGVAYFTAGNYDKAAPLLEEVYRQQPALENLGYYVGLGRYRQKEYKKAVEAFEGADITDPNLQRLGKFYRGLALGVLGLSKEGAAELEDIQRTQTVDPFSQAAARIGQRLATARLGEEPKRFRGQVTFGAFYDDNVAINPNPSSDPIAESFRNRTTTAPGLMASIAADYSFYRKGPFEGTASYSYFQTLNLNDGLSRFNIQDHQLGLSGFYRGTAMNLPYQLAVQYAYDYLFLNMDGFLSRHAPTFSVTVAEPTFTLPYLGTVGNLTTALLRYQNKSFFREPGDGDIRFGSEVRDAVNTMTGFLHVFRFDNDRHFLRFGYQYDNEAAEGTSFSYNGHRLQTGGQVALPWRQISLRYDFDVHFRSYKNVQTLFFDESGLFSNRSDVEQNHLLQIIKPLTSDLTFTAQYQRVRNNSNIPVYDYTKNVVMFLVTWTY